MQLGHDQLAALAAVIRQGSFHGAARVLHVTPSAISQRIKQLEQHVGGVVVVRGKRCTPTAIGEAIHRHALQVELLEKDLLRSLAHHGADSPGPIAIAVNADSLATWLVPALARFTDATGARIDLVLDDQDLTTKWLRSGRVLGAVTSEARPVQGCRVEPLGVMRYVAAASPRFVRRWLPDGITGAALRRAPALMFNCADLLAARFIRQVLGDRTGELQAVHFVPSPIAYVEASLASMGWGVNPDGLVDALIKRKRLVDLAPGRWLDVPLFWQQWALASTSLDALAAALREQAAHTLHQG
jgi:LysR family transcriptional regulator (chromosome initiation inhibitor)